MWTILKKFFKYTKCLETIMPKKNYECNFLILKLIVAIKILIKGLIILKKQYIQYVPVATPNTDACVAPQVFQGKSTEVTVPESSSVRLRFSGLKPRFL